MVRRLDKQLHGNKYLLLGNVIWYITRVFTRNATFRYFLNFVLDIILTIHIFTNDHWSMH